MEVENLREKENTLIPNATAKRLALYYRYLRTLHSQGVLRINSRELSEALQVDSATIRRDFSYFGELGKRGYGYDVENLMNFFAKTLNDDQLTKVALIGVGNLGNALLNFKFYQNNNLRIAAAFDVNPNVIGKEVSGLIVHDMKNMKSVLDKEEINVVILTVPGKFAQDVANQLVDIGVKGILNFTPHSVLTPDDVVVQSVDLTNELQTLIYFMKRQEN
ncbi:MAG: redox-sensing transcriptional repressor Rex [Streptococcaceae bacterium]|jgi:redox-sensing transcriptional repressor|nr:redox-sensing transcriptional repressor Rex [Streptococcaceae bacterium]